LRSKTSLVDDTGNWPEQSKLGDNERSAGRTLCTIFVNIGIGWVRPIAFDFSAQQDEFLQMMNQRYYGSNENVEVALSVYAVDHKEAFTRYKRS
jgi:hypothetical protein